MQSNLAEHSDVTGVLPPDRGPTDSYDVAGPTHEERPEIAATSNDTTTTAFPVSPERRSLYAEVDSLAAEFRATQDPDVAIALADKRFEAAAGYDEEPVRTDWPPVYEDPFPDLRKGRIPEVGTDRLDARTVAGGIKHRGSCIVRGLFSPEQVKRTVESIDRVASLRTEEEPEPDEPDAWYRPYLNIGPMRRGLRRMVIRDGGTWLADSPIVAARVLDDLRQAGVIDLVTEHFGERPFFSLQKSTLRYSEPVHNFAGWHQDGSFLGWNSRTINVWVALSDCGGDHPTPGLEILPRRIERMLDQDGGLGSASISDATVLRTAGPTSLVVPEFKAGDALIFDQKLVHRTHLFPEMTKPRYALECWLFAPAHAPEPYVPLLV
ncbi:MAG: phytanoyl-CoA dioxygenase family protein [Acidimicrobiales bacterium]|nr:phytanoyl-CoA dioxygenase family protein [Acidimicrobiales bacterium]